MKNLAAEKSAAATLKHYRERSQAWRKERNGTFESFTCYRDRWTRDRNITLTGTGVTQDLDALSKIQANWFKS